MPANDYYDSTGTPTSNTLASSASMRSEFNLVEAGFTAAQAALALKANLISPALVTPNLGTPSAGVVTNLTGTAASVSIGGNASTATLAATVTTNANLTGDVTSVGNVTTLTNAPVIAKQLTGYASSTGVISASDTILSAIGKLNGNAAAGATNLTGHVTSVGAATVLGSFTLAQLNTAISNADVATGGGTATGTNTGDQTNITGNAATVTTNANLTGDVTSVGNATTLTNAPVIAKVLTGFSSTTGTVAAADSILTAFNKTTGNIAAKANTASPTFTGTVTIPTPFTLGAVSVLATGTELNFVDGVTSNIQDQFTDKAPIASPTFTGLVTSPTVLCTSATDATSSLAGGAFRTVGGGAIGKKLFVGTDADVGGTLTVTGIASMYAGTSFIGGSSAVGSIWYGATNGLQIRGASGSAYDFVLAAAAGDSLLMNPTGTSHLKVGGSFGCNTPILKTASFTVAASETWLPCAGSGTITVTLPTASAYGGRELRFNNYAAFTVVSASANVIDIGAGGTTTAILPASVGKWVVMASDGTNWRILQAN